MKNIKLSSRDKPGHYHRSVGNLHVLLLSHRQISHHSHRQGLTLTIGTNAPPLLDLVTFIYLFIGNSSHRQLSCSLVTVAPPTDLYSTGPHTHVQKRCQQRRRSAKGSQRRITFDGDLGDAFRREQGGGLRLDWSRGSARVGASI